MKNPYRTLRRVASAVRRVPLRYVNALVAERTGLRVQAGPFAGMRYVDRAVGSALTPKLLGTYERELGPCIERALALAFPLVVDIGAAEGYYAVGVARRSPQARVVAFEMLEAGRRALRELAALNQVPCVEATCVSSRACTVEPVPQGAVELHAGCDLQHLRAVLTGADRALVICDVEGYEDTLLVPSEVPELARATLLVELHEFCRPGISERLRERFASTHEVKRIWQEPRSRSDFVFESWLTKLLPGFYRDWAVSEWRPERMSWLWMEPRAR